MKFVFLFCLNNSGTTVLCQYLAAQIGGYLPPFGNFEGQVAPGVAQLMRKSPWDPEHRMPWDTIRPIWEDLARADGKDIFVEGSPPNVIRVDAIREAFGPENQCLFSAASPYQQIASSLANYAHAPMRTAKINKVVKVWARKMAQQVAFMERFDDIPFVSYDAFCADPTAVNRALGIPVRPVDEVAGKQTTGERQIRNLAPRTIAFLSSSEIDQVTEALEPHRALVEAIGYGLEKGSDLIERCATEPAMIHAALHRRIVWEAQNKVLKT